LPPVLSRFRTLYPEMHVALVLSDHFVDIVEEDFDLAIRISGPQAGTSTIWRRLCKVARVLVASPTYLTARGTPALPAELGDHDCLAYHADAGGEVWELAHKGCRHNHR